MLDFLLVLPYNKYMKLFKTKGSHAYFHIQLFYVCRTVDGNDFSEKEVANRLQDIHKRLAEKFGINIEEQEIEKNYITLRFQAKPTTQLSTFINSLKTISSRILKKEFPNHFQTPHLWESQYLLVTYGENPQKILQEYLQKERC